MRVLVASLLALPLLTLAPAPAHAVASCAGLPATIESSGGAVTGTEGPDVIVATAPAAIHALGGDDTICVAGGDLDAGSGNDRVWATGLGGQVADLGPGDDTYVGDAQTDTVDRRARESEGTDHIDTGTGLGDSVGSGVPGQPNHDVVISASTATLDLYAPAGSDVQLSGAIAITFTAADRADYIVDVPGGDVTRNGTRIVSFDPEGSRAFDIYGRRAAFVLRGGPESDAAVVNRVASFRADLRGGRDSVLLVEPGPVSGRIEGGRGQDLLRVRAASSIIGDLGLHYLTQRSGKRQSRWAVANIDSFVLTARNVDLTGTVGHDDLMGYGCSITFDGAGGPDVLSVGDVAAGPQCVTRGFLYGGPGADVLNGNSGPDVLIGGPDEDRAFGAGGIDRCVAEHEVKCER